MITELQLAEFRERLEHMRDALAAQHDAGKSAADTVVLDQTKVGRLSRMDALQQQNIAQSSQRKVANRLRRVISALAKIESGDYGYCDECGGEIAIARLEVQPEAALCIQCQSRQEF